MLNQNTINSVPFPVNLGNHDDRSPLLQIVFVAQKIDSGGDCPLGIFFEDYLERPHPARKSETGAKGGFRGESENRCAWAKQCGLVGRVSRPGKHYQKRIANRIRQSNTPVLRAMAAFMLNDKDGFASAAYELADQDPDAKFMAASASLTDPDRIRAIERIEQYLADGTFSSFTKTHETILEKAYNRLGQLKLKAK